jgi:hypothetical protein
LIQKYSIRGRLSLQLLNDQTISYNKFKKAFRKAKCLYEYTVQVLAKSAIAPSARNLDPNIQK